MLVGRHNVDNILAAIAVGLAMTVDGGPIPLKVGRLEIFSRIFPKIKTSVTGT